MTSPRAIRVADADAMEALGARIAAAGDVLVMFLSGDLGAGKTTLVRGFLRARGHAGTVRSPTYTLVETYPLAGGACHFDLYRLADPYELELIGARDCFDGRTTCLVEWPEHGQPLLPVPDLAVSLALAPDGARTVVLDAMTAAGRKVLDRLEFPS